MNNKPVVDPMVEKCRTMVSTEKLICGQAKMNVVTEWLAAGQSARRTITLNRQRKLLSANAGFQRLHILLFILLSMVLMAVLFLLPSMVNSPAFDPLTGQGSANPAIEQLNGSGQGAAQTPVLPAPADSPWNDAQLAKQRRLAQDVLSEIMAVQERLDSKKVELWGKADYAKAVNEAEQGDQAYQSRQFDLAQSRYKQSLTRFEQLFEQIDPVFDQAFALGKQAVVNNEPEQAIEQLSLAIVLKPADQPARTWYARAQVLTDVLALIEQGQQLMARQQFGEAKQLYQQALALDGASQVAKDSLQLAQQAMVELSFKNAMSSGFTALSQKRHQQAIKAFRQAAAIKPNARDAQEAISQAENQFTEANIAGLFVQAEQAEQAEQWHDAMAHYEKIMQADDSVIKARIGLIRSKARADLDDKLNGAMAEPQRLTSESVYRQAQRLLADARGIQPAGERLHGQIAQLATLLTAVKQPVKVEIQSDNQTLVTLYKVGELGAFAAKRMDLKPGKYTLVGTRSGYRDIRREITLMPGNNDTTVVVQCEEKVSL